MPPLQVRLSDTYVQAAKGLFPVGGSPSGWPPSYELFCELPQEAAIIAFSRAWDHLTESVPGISAMRLVETFETPVFPPVIFWGVLSADGVVDIIDLTTDLTYWELVGDDPQD